MHGGGIKPGGNTDHKRDARDGGPAQAQPRGRRSTGGLLLMYTRADRSQADSGMISRVAAADKAERPEAARRPQREAAAAARWGGDPAAAAGERWVSRRQSAAVLAAAQRSINRRSAVDLAEHHVQCADDGHHVRQHVLLDHRVQRLRG